MEQDNQPKSSENHPWIGSYPDGMRWDAPVRTYPIFEMLETTAEKYGDSGAVDFLGTKYTWSEIHDQALRLAKGLQDMGVAKGTKVGLFMPNCPYFIIAYYAIAKIGATAVNYNPLYAEAELVNQIEDSETDVMITVDLELTHSKMLKMLSNTRLNKLVICSFIDILPFPKNFLFKYLKGKELADIPSDKRHVAYDDLIDNDGKPQDVQIDVENDVAVLQYTGGTTGLPKGAMLTHANITANVEQAGILLHMTRKGEDKMVGVLPFFHVFAMTAVMNISVLKGWEIVMLPRFDLDQTLKLIHKHKPQIFPAVPAIYTAINNHKKLASFDLTSLEFCISGGAPLPAEVKKKFEEKTGAQIFEGYGLTEAAPILSCSVPGVDNKPGTIGPPFPQTVIQIVDPEDKTTLMPAGERGELCAIGPQVMKGYWNKPDDSASTLKEVDGQMRLHTGDIAIMDEDGFMYIVDRIKDLIITNGYNVYPRNVEEAIYKHPSVEECIVAGLPDTNRGEIVKAWIKRKEGRELTVEDLKKFLEDKISPMEIPKRVEFREEPLPKTMIGKLSRKDILEEELGKS
ncbi:MAG: long-chain fatty acid--CoA ligase [Pseudomonadota bacterium]